MKNRRNKADVIFQNMEDMRKLYRAVAAEHGPKHPEAQKLWSKVERQRKAWFERMRSIRAQGLGNPAASSPEGDLWFSEDKYTSI